MAIIRLALFFAISLVGAGFALTDAATNVFGSAPPSWAESLVSRNANAVVEINDRLPDRGIQQFSTEEVKEAAKRALVREPLNATAVRHLSGRVGFQTEDRPDARYLQLAERVTRRDRETQLGLLLDELLTRDAARAFTHLDRLLTVRPSMVHAALPQLVALLEIEEGRELYRDNADRPWFSMFLQKAMSGAVKPASVADFFSEFRPAAEGIDQIDLERFAGRLANLGFYDRALKIATISSENTQAVSEFEPNVETVEEALAPLTWMMASDVAGSAALAKKGLVDVQLDSGSRIVALDRVYRPSKRVSQLEMLVSQQTGNVALVNWSIHCLDEAVWKPAWETGWFSAEQDVHVFAVSNSCETPRWRMEAQAGEGQRGSNFSFRIALN